MEPTRPVSDPKPELESRESGDAKRITRPHTVITDNQRNGSIAGIALLLGFSLSFTATWSQGDEP
jgi:hypothetical protein